MNYNHQATIDFVTAIQTDETIKETVLDIVFTTASVNGISVDVGLPGFILPDIEEGLERFLVKLSLEGLVDIPYAKANRANFSEITNHVLDLIDEPVYNTPE